MLSVFDAEIPVSRFAFVVPKEADCKAQQELTMRETSMLASVLAHLLANSSVAPAALARSSHVSYYSEIAALN